MTKPGGEWTPCPPRQIEQLAGRLRNRRRRRVWLRSVAAVVATSVLVTATMLWTLRPGRTAVGEMTCSEVMDAAEDYRNDRLSDEVRARIDAHLDHCPNCRDYYRELKILMRRDAARASLALLQGTHGTLQHLARRPAQLGVSESDGFLQL